MSEQRSLGRHLATIVGDFPNAIRFRLRALRDWATPGGYGEGEKVPVVVLPGVYETWHYLRPVTEALSAAGHPVHCMTALGINHRPIPASAKIVWDRILELELSNFAIVAHSKGGLIGKHLLAFEDVDRRIDRLIAIASPFNGTRMAKYMIPAAVREFRPDDPTVSALVAEQTVNSRIVSIEPTWDPHIPDGSTLDGARNLRLPVVGHFRILLNEELPQLVIDELEREMPA
jgi:hypothetical protein